MKKNVPVVLVVLLITFASLLSGVVYGDEGVSFDTEPKAINICAVTNMLSEGPVELGMFKLSTEYFDNVEDPWCEAVWDISVSFCIGVTCIAEFEGECSTGGEYQCPGFGAACDDPDFPDWPIIQ